LLAFGFFAGVNIMIRNKTSPFKHCQGLSLVELMIGMALGLGVMLAAVMAYHTLRSSWLTMQSIDAMHHNANAAFDNLQNSIQGAGAIDLHTEADGAATLPNNSNTDWGATEGQQQSDSLWVGHPRIFNPVDCQGNRAGNHDLIRNSYQRNSKNELTCKDLNMLGSTYQALAEGVEDFQVQFAERHDPANSEASFSLQWKRADQVELAAGVVAIEVCLRLASTTVFQAAAPNLLGCQNETLIHDGKLRRVYRRIFVIRPHLPSLS
jgi:type IV pilus assembly protein PilW